MGDPRGGVLQGGKGGGGGGVGWEPATVSPSLARVSTSHIVGSCADKNPKAAASVRAARSCCAKRHVGKTQNIMESGARRGI